MGNVKHGGFFDTRIIYLYISWGIPRSNRVC